MFKFKLKYANTLQSLVLETGYKNVFSAQVKALIGQEQIGNLSICYTTDKNNEL